MGSKSAKKFYAVRVGRNPGIYYSWREAQQQINGFGNATFRGFREYSAAQQYMNEHAPQSTPCCAPPPTDSRGTNVCAPSRSSYSAHLYFDGGSRGNPGVAGAGAVLLASNACDELAFVSEHIQCHTTNNVAEYRGLLAGLRLAHQWLTKDVPNLVVCGDSNLVNAQMANKYSVRNPYLLELYQCAKVLQQSLAPIQVSYEHVSRELNKRADELANTAMDNCSTFAYAPSIGFYKPESAECLPPKTEIADYSTNSQRADAGTAGRKRKRVMS
jgi:ribonuclease HI